jgi:hypothetical protein
MINNRIKRHTDGRCIEVLCLMEETEEKYLIIQINILIKDLFRTDPFMYTDFMSQREYIGVVHNRDTASK